MPLNLDIEFEGDGEPELEIEIELLRRFEDKNFQTSRTSHAGWLCRISTLHPSIVYY